MNSILFKPHLIIENCAGRKTETRRLAGLSDVNLYDGLLSGKSSLGTLGYQGLLKTPYYLADKWRKAYWQKPKIYHAFLGMLPDGGEINPIPVKCPYGAAGDHLWVRETWNYITKVTNEHYTHVHPDGYPVEMLYRADAIAGGWDDQCSWNPSIFMPRWASRDTLLIKSIHCERVQEVTEAGARAEGMLPNWVGDDLTGWDPDEHGYLPIDWEKRHLSNDYVHYTAREAFALTWDVINAKPKAVKKGGEVVYYVSYPWENIRETRQHRGLPWHVIGNPFVWVIKYKLMEVGNEN